MRKRGQPVGIGIAVLLAALFCGTSGYGGPGGSWSGDPTNQLNGNGLHISSDAPGTKLYGTIEVSYFAINSEFNALSLSSVLRLRQGNTLHTFYSGMIAPPEGIAVSDPSVIQDLLTATFKSAIVQAFFPANYPCADRQNLRLKNATELSGQNYCTSWASSTVCAVYDRFDVADIEIAVDTVSCK